MNEEDLVSHHLRLTKTQSAGLLKLNIKTIGDLLRHLPTRYESASEIKTVNDAVPGETATIYGHFSTLEMKKSFRTRVPMAEGAFTDATGSIRVVWFHQPYLAKMILPHSLVRIRGKVSEKNGKKYLANPTVEKAHGAPDIQGEGGFFPVYAETGGVTSMWFYHAIKRALQSGVCEKMEDPIPKETRARYRLPSLGTALSSIHEPKKEKEVEVARKRFAFEDVFLIQVARAEERARMSRERAYEIDANEQKVAEFIKTFPFTPTAGQKKAIGEILADFLLPHPMHRLLEGDVGSGKTAVAAATAYAVSTSRPYCDVRHHNMGGGSQKQDFGRLQVAYMCPTEILAKQHFKTFTDFFVAHPIQIGLITSSGCFKFPSKVNPREATPISRAQFLKWVANGEIPIVIGTHALIEKSVAFKHLAYVIIDEQHRFGTMQRRSIATKGDTRPHLLSMTATPIPRTLALTLYGDLDLTVLDELPKGRKPVITEIVPASRRTMIYHSVQKLVEEGRQAYVICPRIDEPDPEKQMALQARSVASEAKHLKEKIFPDLVIEKLHSKMSPKEKEETMNRFAAGDIHILVATSVVEVGVNVPNATVIMIEGAERFGLAQLHQLRGRVMRSTHQPYCFLMVDSAHRADSARLKAIKEAKNGFELAEKDFAIRGAGELYGRKQWGLSDIGMEALKNLKLVEAARQEATRIIKEDPTLSRFPPLKKRATQKMNILHFE